MIWGTVSILEHLHKPWKVWIFKPSDMIFANLPPPEADAPWAAAVATHFAHFEMLRPPEMPFLWYTGWWYTYPSEKYEFVSWEGLSHILWKNKSHVWNHQPVIINHD